MSGPENISRVCRSHFVGIGGLHRNVRRGQRKTYQ
jgi:hypothetical protein